MESSFIKLRNTNKLGMKTDFVGVYVWFCLLLFFFNEGKVHGFNKDTVNYFIYRTETSADRDHLLSRALFICTFKHKTLLYIHGNIQKIILGHRIN